MPEPIGRLVLDTHVWVWLMEGSPELGESARIQIEAAVPEGHLLVSAISVWELAMLESKGRISFAEECGVWVRNALAAPGISLVPLEPQIAVTSTRLPAPFHGDPADRIIVATARTLGATLVTADREILAYADTGQVRALKPG